MLFATLFHCVNFLLILSLKSVDRTDQESEKLSTESKK